MSMLEEINNEIKKGNAKWKILKYDYEKEIEKMLNNRISLQRQIEIILKYTSIKKLDRREYHDILVKYFGYTGTRKIKISKIKEDPKKEKSVFKTPVKAVKKVTGTAEEKLSKDINLMDHFLEQESLKA